jgi:hypothetical protein
MNTLREALQEYLALRRGLGFKMHEAGLVLPRFVAFMEEHQALHITTPSVPMMMRQAPAGSLPLRAEVTTSNGYARFEQ